MAAAGNHAAQNMQRLADLITQRRASLGWSKEKAADEAGISYTTYTRVEEAQNVQAQSLVKIESALGIAPGAGRAVLRGDMSLKLADGGELLDGSKITPIQPEWLEEEVQRAVTDAAIGTIPEATGEKIQELQAKVIETLRRRGVLPESGE
ncbi:helix-turn-helix domain-containing protein [Streptomyces sp. 184]|uniref:helix-turn-helix domain-containing protein n=1 Tax=Streptomyces sp. 184 TaxID=1827526 RepID=UPI00389197ED